MKDMFLQVDQINSHVNDMSNRCDLHVFFRKGIVGEKVNQSQ